ncbi:MAG: 3-dehydroquinate synthase [Planctomycetota bacterium]
MVSKPDDSMNAGHSIHVDLGERSYPIRVTGGASSVAAGSDSATGDFARHGQFLRACAADANHWLVVFDEAVREKWAEPLSRGLGSGEVRVDSFSVASGETSKSIDSIGRMWNWILESGADRKTVLVAVGGGVIGDLAGFAAATFARGIRFVQVPTTLLAMVDSSVGGKTGINLPGAKNMVGAFWQPEAVLVDTDVLSTLSDRSYRSGLGEVVKYGVIEDAEFFGWLESNAGALVARDSSALQHAIDRSCRSKARVVNEDERETSGRRAILNYGHTFAHAIEATAGYGKLLHGEAVAIGMQMAARLAIAMSMAPPELLTRQTELLQNCGLPTEFEDADVEAMLTVMQRDKKVSHGKLRFILPTRIGHVELVGDVCKDEVRRAILGR